MLKKGKFIQGLSRPALPNKPDYDSGVMQIATFCKLAFHKFIRHEKVSNLLCETDRETAVKIKCSLQIISAFK